MHETQTAPHDPYRKLATFMMVDAIRNYIAPKPKDNGGTMYQTRVNTWHRDRDQASHFLLRDQEGMGAWETCCFLIKVDPGLARKDMIKAVEGGPEKLKELVDALDKQLEIQKEEERSAYSAFSY